MAGKSRVFGKSVGIMMAAVIVGFLLYLWLPLLSLINKETDHKVYVAFGFHGNLYHSFRIDTNDEAGFGKDIRIIRKEIEVLDKYNKMGVPVKGVWDIENLFSLQDKIPKYAPDIIKDMQRRVKENGDEMLIMSYNNGLVSGMNPREFRDSIERAITNRYDSGVKDIFGEYSPIVRPQEMMATPGNFAAYKKLGIDSIVLYYSAITFDAIRSFIPQLSKEDAHNPLTYHNPETKEKMTVIPAYNIGDLIENVSLRIWARDLHRAQLRGDIDRDVLIFINFDADDEYWYGYDLPQHLKFLPNTGGLDQLIASVKDVSYIKFTTVQEYLDKHPPQKEISFGQDTADGSFNGYNSWSEKSYVHDYWTQLEHNRRHEKVVKRVFDFLGQALAPDTRSALKKAYEKRLRLLSTTNFGMATPYLARGREQVVEELIDDMQKEESKALDRAFGQTEKYLARLQPLQVSTSLEAMGRYLYVPTEEKSRGSELAVLKFYLPKDKLKGRSVHLYTQGGDKLRAREMVRKPLAQNMLQIKMILSGKLPKKEIPLFLFAGDGESTASPSKSEASASTEELVNDTIRIVFNEQGFVEKGFFAGRPVLERGSLLPYVVYDHQHKSAELQVEVLKEGKDGVAQIRLHGPFPLKGVPHSRAGQVDYTLTLVAGVPYLFLDGRVDYPETYRDDVIKPYKPQLARRIDNRWMEVAPAELRLAFYADKDSPFRVHKRNYFDITSSYDIDYYRHSHKNLELANVNNHITAEYVAVTGKGQGAAVAMDTERLANFAFAPLKMEHSSHHGFELKINPFGTYFGEQYYQPTWGRGYGFEAAFITGQQYASAAKTYNGYTNSFNLMFSFFSGEKISTKVKRDLISYARPPKLVGPFQRHSGKWFVRTRKTLPAPAGPLALYGEKNDQKGLIIHWEKVLGKGIHYEVHILDQDKKPVEQLTTSRTSLHWTKARAGDKYFVRVYAKSDKAGLSPASEEVSVVARQVELKGKGPQIPMVLQLKILFAYLVSLIS